MSNHVIPRPKWIDVLMLLVRVALFMMVTQLIRQGEWQMLLLLGWWSCWIFFYPAKEWVERLAGVRS